MCIGGGGGGGLTLRKVCMEEGATASQLLLWAPGVEKAILKDCVVIFTLRSSILCTCVDGLNNY